MSFLNPKELKRSSDIGVSSSKAKNVHSERVKEIDASFPRRYRS